jgi:hypothetical protein
MKRMGETKGMSQCGDTQRSIVHVTHSGHSLWFNSKEMLMCSDPNLSISSASDVVYRENDLGWFD